MNCYVCKLPTTVNIPETADTTGMFVPCCQKCYQTYSVEGAWRASAERIANLETLRNIIEKAQNLRYTISVTSDVNPWELEEMLELLYKLENEL